MYISTYALEQIFEIIIALASADLNLFKNTEHTNLANLMMKVYIFCIEFTKNFESMKKYFWFFQNGGFF